MRALTILLICLGLALIFIALLNLSQNSPCNQPPVKKPGKLEVSNYPPSVHLVSNEPPWKNEPHCVNEFFGYMSTATTSSGANGNGLNLLGQYCEGTNTTVVHGETSLQSAADLAKFPLTHRAGHPFYYDTQTEWGQLKGCNWKDHVHSQAMPLDEASFTPEAILLVEGQGGLPVIVSISGNIRLRGIVVRRGGVLFIDEDVPTTLRVNFIMVETGGLLQAGSPDAPPGKNWDFRFQGKLEIIMTHPPDGYGTMPVPTSQCSYHAYAPGVDGVLPSESSSATFSSFDGTNMCFTNSFAAKAICAGFNGSYCFCGSATIPVAYTGTWKALEQDGTTRTNGIKSLSIGTPLLEVAYPLCWARLAPGSGTKGSSVLQLHADDVARLSLSDVQRVFINAQVIVTSSSPQYTTDQNVSGMSPLYIADKDARPNDDTTENMKQNTQAFNDYRSEFLYPDRGSEIVVVLAVNAINGTFALTLRDKLKLSHELLPVDLMNGDKKATIEITHHVGVLTHNIVIDGQDLVDKNLSSGGGCNVTLPSGTPRAMALGLANQTAKELMRPVMKAASPDTEDAEDAEDGVPLGSGGALTYNYVKPIAAHLGEISQTCYLNQDEVGKSHLTAKDAKPTSADAIRGSWLFGTAGATGCNAIFGGSLMFRYGSSVWMDSVEVVRMGTAPNFGSIGQYAVHFHLFGFAKSFKGYLRSSKYSRDATVRNCSIWRSYSRFVTLHGACEVDVSNNVCCITYGSAMFVEDGTEQLNVFQHNMLSCVFPNCTNKFYNPTPIYANVSTDFCTYSLFWLKNNLNVVARNIGSCSHGNCAFVWYVPQSIGCLRGPSAVCLGSEKLGLPACGSIDAIALSNVCGLGTQVPIINNANGRLVLFKSGYKCANNQHCACWIPEDFAYPFIDPSTGCVSYTADNSTAPGLLQTENVCYCLPLYQSEFPEALKGGPQSVDGAKFSDGTPGCNWSFQDQQPQSQFLPANGQNACTDLYITTYSGTTWLENNFKFQPLTTDERKKASGDCMQYSIGGTSAYNYIPKIYSGLLTFNLGATNGLWGGVGWTKAAPPMFLDCCFLETSDRITGKKPPTPMGWSEESANVRATAMYPWGSAAFIGSNNWDDSHTLANLYVVYHNFITNGTLSLSSNVTVYTGDKTFIDTRTTTCLHPGEYTHSAGATLAVAVFDFDFQDVFGSVWDRLGDSCGPGRSQYNQAQVFSYTDMSYWNVKFGSISAQDVSACNWAKATVVKKGHFKLPPGGDWPGQPVKYPFMCGGSQDEFGLLSARDSALKNIPWINGKTVNMLTAQFGTSQAQDVGNRICQALSQTWWNVQSVSSDGTIFPLTYFPYDQDHTLTPQTCLVKSDFMLSTSLTL